MDQSHQASVVAPHEEHHLQDDSDYDYVRLRDTSVTSQTTILPPGSACRVKNPFARFWDTYLRVSVPHVECRDHLANERTFLGYLRSSLGLSFLGIIIAQLYRLQHAPHPDPVFGYYVLGKPVAAIMQASALITILVGAHRFWRQQSAMVRGKIHAAGWEIYFVSSYALLLLIGLFAIHVGVDVYKMSK